MWGMLKASGSLSAVLIAQTGGGGRLSISLSEHQNSKFRYLSWKCEIRGIHECQGPRPQLAEWTSLGLQQVLWRAIWGRGGWGIQLFLASLDGVQHLQSMLEKDPAFETSPNWPQLVEWCSTCISFDHHLIKNRWRADEELMKSWWRADEELM